MSSIEIGKTSDGKIVTFDVDGIWKQRLLVQAISGGGKSETVKTIVRKIKEAWKTLKLYQQSAELQVIILDFEGEYPILRVTLPLILIGESGELPISVDDATKYGEEIRKSGASCIIDLSSLKQDLERERFTCDFINAILDVDKKYWNDCIIVIDEAHLLCSQSEDSESRRAIIRLCQTGRKRGIGTILVTQSIAEINKRASRQMANRIIGQTVEIADRDRAIEMLNPIKENIRQVFTRLGMFESGEFFSFGRSIKVDGVLPALEKQPIEFKLNYDPSIKGDELDIPPLNAEGRIMLNDLTFRLESDKKQNIPQPDPQQNPKKEQTVTTDGKINVPEENKESMDRLAELEKQEKELLLKRQIARKEEEIKKIKKEISEKENTKEYIISDPDENGVVSIDKTLAQTKLDELYRQLENAKGFWEKNKIKGQISKINTAIATTKINNGMIKTAKVAQKIGTTVTTITNSIGDIGKSFGSIGGDYNNDSQNNKKSNGKTKKGKKKQKQNNNNDDNNTIKDMGFTPENIFGNKEYDNFFGN